MPRFEVSVPEVWYQTYSIEAATAEAALEVARKGEGTPVDMSLEYSHSLLESLDPIHVSAVKS